MNEQNITLHMHDARFSVGFFFRRCMTKNLLIFLLVQMPINLNPAAEETTLGSTNNYFHFVVTELMRNIIMQHILFYINLFTIKN